MQLQCVSTPQSYQPFVDRSEVVSGLIREGQIATLSGPWAIGKTPLLVELALAVTNGLPWQERAVEQRPVILFDFDTQPAQFASLVSTIAARMGASLGEFRASAEVHLFRELSQSIMDASLPQRLRFLETALERQPNALVTIDPAEWFFLVPQANGDSHLRWHTVARALRRLLYRFPSAAIVLTFQTCPSRCRYSLHKSPRAWLQRSVGRALFGRTDVDLGFDGRGLRGCTARRALA